MIARVSGALLLSRTWATVGRFQASSPRCVAARLDIGRRERMLGCPVRSKEVVVLVSVELEPDRDTRGDESQALEEIRQLFARYRRIARHGVVAERAEPVEVRAEEANGAPVRSER